MQMQLCAVDAVSPYAACSMNNCEGRAEEKRRELGSWGQFRTVWDSLGQETLDFLREQFTVLTKMICEA